MTTSHSTVCVVDDDASVRQALRRLLKAMGFSVATFGSAEEFLNSDSPTTGDCLILDVCMPGIGGLDLQRRLSISKLKIPVIFITAHEDIQARKCAMKNGAVAFLLKPFEEEKLLDAISSALRQHGSREDNLPLD
jgi:FixJ family two-component response regulator